MLLILGFSGLTPAPFEAAGFFSVAGPGLSFETGAAEFLVEVTAWSLDVWALLLVVVEAVALAEVAGWVGWVGWPPVSPAMAFEAGSASLLWLRGTERSMPMSRPANKKGEGGGSWAQLGVGMMGLVLPSWRLFFPGFLRFVMVPRVL